MDRIDAILSPVVSRVGPQLGETVSSAAVVQNSNDGALRFPMSELLPEVDSASLWREVLAGVAEGLDQEIFQAWIKPLELGATSLVCQSGEGEDSVDVTGVEVEIRCPNKFSADYVADRFLGRFKDKFSELLGISEVEIFLKANRAVAAPTRIASSSRVSERPAGDSPATNGTPVVHSARVFQRAETNLNPYYNFSNFVVGDCNQLAHAVALRVAENPGSHYNPFFIYGGVGLGKTHLANAVGNAASRRHKKVLLVSSEYFVSELISALRGNKMSQFKNRFRTLDVLIIDDIQFIIGKERTQEEFFHTFNELHQHNKQIIITSDKLPQELVGLEERLRTRFSSGLAVDLQAPDFETRVAILIRKSEALGASIPEDVARILAQRIDTNVRELEGALNRLLALSSIARSEITPELAEEVLKSVLPRHGFDLNVESIQKYVAERYSVSIHDLLGKRRTQNIAFARQIGMFLARRLTGCSFPEIGAFFGGRDHSTVIHACRVIEERTESDDRFRLELESLERELRA